MKWTLIIGGFLLLSFFMAPVIFRAMKRHDYNTLYNGMQAARAEGGSFHDDPKVFHSYSDKYVYGLRDEKKRPK